MEQDNKIQEAARLLAERSKNPEVALADGKKKGVLVVIDGKPPVADNTTMMLCFVAFSAIDDGRPTVYFSLELSNIQVVNRLIAIITGIDHEKIVGGQLDADEWKLIDEKVPALMDAPLYVDDTEYVTTDSLRERLSGLAEKGVTLAVIDHIGKVASGGVDVEGVLSDLKAIAEQLEMTIMAVSD